MRVDQALRVPVSWPALSTTLSFHVPCSCSPSKADSGWAGRNVPVNGAAPELIAVAASSSKTVVVRLSPLLPLRLNSRTVVPAGEIRSMVRSESNVWVICPTVALTSVTMPDAEMARLEVTPAGTSSGIALGTSLDPYVVPEPGRPVGRCTGSAMVPALEVTEIVRSTVVPQTSDGATVAANGGVPSAAAPGARFGHVEP